MEKKNKIILIITIIFTISIILLCIFSVKKKDVIEPTDAVKFKEEYESLNGTIESNSDKVYPSVDVSTENQYKYKSPEDILDVLYNDTAIIYFGYAKCPWCRNIIAPLSAAAKEENASTIYYVNIESIRDEYILENGKVKLTNKGTNAYREILSFLHDKVSDYNLEDSDGTKIPTNKKRIFAPTVVAVKNGEIKDLHEGTLETQKDPYTSLTDEEKNNLKDIYKKLIESLNDSYCTSKSC
jgi:hypothetical protein